MNRWVDITFDCYPLRSISRLDAPIDASPEFGQLCQRVSNAVTKHGRHNTYYLCNARCGFHLTNDEQVGTVAFRFEGTVLTDPDDMRTVGADLQVELDGETCDWLTQGIVDWFAETVSRAVQVEFDRYIAVGDLTKTIERLDRFKAEHEAQGGYVGFGL